MRSRQYSCNGNGGNKGTDDIPRLGLNLEAGRSFVSALHNLLMAPSAPLIERMALIEQSPSEFVVWLLTVSLDTRVRNDGPLTANSLPLDLSATSPEAVS